MNIEEESRQGDFILDEKGVRLFVDMFSAQYLNGVAIDYVTNMMGSGFTFTNPALVNPTTGLPSQLASVLIGRRNVEGGGRDDDLEHTDYRIVAGIRGDLLRGLSYDAYYQFGTSRRAETYFNDFSVVRLQRAIDVVSDPTTGAPVCR